MSRSRAFAVPVAFVFLASAVLFVGPRRTRCPACHPSRRPRTSSSSGTCRPAPRWGWTSRATGPSSPGPAGLTVLDIAVPATPAIAAFHPAPALRERGRGSVRQHLLVIVNDRGGPRRRCRDVRLRHLDTRAPPPGRDHADRPDRQRARRRAHRELRERGTARRCGGRRRPRRGVRHRRTRPRRARSGTFVSVASDSAAFTRDARHRARRQGDAVVGGRRRGRRIPADAGTRSQPQLVASTSAAA